VTTRAIDLTAIAGASFSEAPFRHCVIRQSFGDWETTAVLATEFPTAGFRYDVRDANAGGHKRYRAHNYPLLDFGVPHDEHIGQLTPRWRQVIDEVGRKDYGAAMAEATRTDLRNTVLDVRMARYAADGWIEPHVDRPDKVVTHLFYLNLGWDEGRAGALRLLRGPDLDDHAIEVFPHAGISVVIVGSERAWHGVSPVRNSNGEDRRMFIVHFARPPAVSSAHGTPGGGQ
jgi:2OG-Fe(II) oxygenase superfamily